MKKLLLLLFLSSSAFAQTQKSDAALIIQANVIRDEATPGANTAARVATMFKDIVASKASKQGVYSVVDYGATGNGSTDDTAAIQAAIDAAATGRGKLYFPPPSNYYRINSTLNFQHPANNQAFFDVEATGSWEYCIVYHGANNQPATKWIGLKAGSVRGLKVKIASGITGAICFEIGTTATSESTSGFSFYDCTAALNTGINNQGFRLGEVEGGGRDVSQISFINCKAEGSYTGVAQTHYVGQIGFNITGVNTLAFTWVGGAAIFCETGVKLEQGGSLFFNGFQASHNGTDFWMQWANVLNIDGGRFELSNKFLKVDQSTAHPIVNVTGVMIEEPFGTDGGKIIEFLSPGTLTLTGISINRTSGVDLTASMITIGTPVETPYGSLTMTGGRVSAADPFYTDANSRWNGKIERVVRVNPTTVVPSGYFTNRDF